MDEHHEIELNLARIEKMDRKKWNLLSQMVGIKIPQTMPS